MNTSLKNAPFITIGIGIVLCIIISTIVFVCMFYMHIFRLSPYDVSLRLPHSPSSCTHISECDLLPGDILIRRYITSRTTVFEHIIHPYFTHSAFYMGNDQIAEAVGSEKNPQDDVAINSLSKSDWMNMDIPDWFIIRPIKNVNTIPDIDKNLKVIADDPNYIFGFVPFLHKKTSCSDLIYRQLSEHNMVDHINTPNIITPDYLFFTLTNSPETFEIIGYHTSVMLP